MGEERQFQEQVRKATKERWGWRTWKNVGTVALPGMPDTTFVTAWGLMGMLEFKAGMPETAEAARNLLKGAQVAVTRELWMRKAPCLLLVGKGRNGAIVLEGADPRALLEYLDVDVLADQLEGWARHWVDEAKLRTEGPA